VLMNNVATMLCDGCQQRLSGDILEAKRQYEESEAKPLPGFLAGTLMGAVLAVAWGYIAYFDLRDGDYYPKLWVLGSVAMAFLVCFAMSTAIGKINALGMVIAMLLAAATKIAGDALLFGLVAAYADKVAMSAAYFQWGLQNVFVLKWDLNGFIAISDPCIWVWAGWMLKSLAPKFDLKFEPTGVPVVVVKGATS